MVDHKQIDAIIKEVDKLVKERNKVVFTEEEKNDSFFKMIEKNTQGNTSILGLILLDSVENIYDEQVLLLLKYASQFLKVLVSLGIHELTDIQAICFGSLECLLLNNLEELTDTQAESLLLINNNRNKQLTLGIKQITDKQAELIAGYLGKLTLPKLEKLTNKQLEYLSKSACTLELDGIKEISDEQLEILSKKRGKTSLKGLKLGWFSTLKRKMKFKGEVIFE